MIQEIDSFSEYAERRVHFIRHVPEVTLVRPSYIDEYYPAAFLETKKSIERVTALGEAVALGLEAVIATLEAAEITQLTDEVRKTLESLRSVPYVNGLIRPDYLLDDEGLPQLCEIGTRFIFNGVLASYLINKEAHKLFSAEPLDGLFQCEQTLARHISGNIGVVKESEPGYDIHFLRLLNPAVQLYGIGELHTAMNHHDHLILELHQHELVEVLDDIVAYMLDGGIVLNDPRSILIGHNKRLLHVLGDEAAMTRLVEPYTATLLGSSIVPTFLPDKDVETKEVALRHKDDWIAKNGISGKTYGLTIGKLVDEETWKRALDEDDQCVQPYVHQKIFHYVDFEGTQACHLVGTLPIFNIQSFGPSVYRAFRADDNKFKAMMHPVKI